MKYLLSLLLLSSLLLSKEVFLNKNWVQAKGTYTSSDAYCHPTKNNSGDFCQKEALSYPVLRDAPDVNIANQVETIVKKAITAYKKGDLKKTVMKNISDESYQPRGTWNTDNALDLFSVTDTTFTMQDIGSGYTGGAHGYFSVNYDNYSHEGKLLTLDDLLKKDYNTTLNKIAKKVYKKSVGLKADETLLNDGWFSDKFVLTPNFAITDRGLLFHYNTYEIKPYAAGHTEFMIPYSAMHTLIDPEGPLKTYLAAPDKRQTSYVNDEVASLHLSVERISPGQIRVVVKEKVWAYAKQGWLSLSFPELKKKQEVRISDSEGFKSTKRYPAGSKIYHYLKKKAVKSNYLLVEGETQLKDNSKDKQITLIVTVPPRNKSLRIRVRTSFKNGKKLLTMPSVWDGIKGQQAFSNYEFTFPLQ